MTCKKSASKRTYFERMGMRIRRAREAANLSQTQLAEICQVHRNTVYRWELSISCPSAYELSLLREEMARLDVAL